MAREQYLTMLLESLVAFDFFEFRRHLESAMRDIDYRYRQIWEMRQASFGWVVHLSWSLEAILSNHLVGL